MVLRASCRIVQRVMSMKPPVDSNTEGARNTDLIPMQSEHELGKLLMNANHHEKHRKAHFERNERLPVRQPANRMEGGHHRGKIPVDRRSSLSAQVFQIRPQRKRHSADVSGEGNFDQYVTNDKIDWPLATGPNDQTKASEAATLPLSVPASRCDLVGVYRCRAPRSERPCSVQDFESGVRGIWQSMLPAAFRHFSIASVQSQKKSGLSQTASSDRADTRHTSFDCRAAQTRPQGKTWIHSCRYRSPRQQGWQARVCTISMPWTP